MPTLAAPPTFDPATAARLRADIVQGVALLFTTGVIQPSGHGNVSARLGADLMLLTSNPIIRGLTADQIAVVTFTGEVLDGRLEATTAEIIPQHAVAYRTRPEVRAVVHTHSPHATAFAAANVPLPCAYEPLLRHGIEDAVPVAAWAPRGSPESIRNVEAQLAAAPHVPAVLLGNHGLLAFGDTALHAAQLVVVLDEAARVALYAQALGGVTPFPAGAAGRARARMATFGASAFGTTI